MAVELLSLPSPYAFVSLYRRPTRRRLYAPTTARKNVWDSMLSLFSLVTHSTELFASGTTHLTWVSIIREVHLVRKSILLAIVAMIILGRRAYTAGPLEHISLKESAQTKCWSCDNEV